MSLHALFQAIWLHQSHSRPQHPLGVLLSAPQDSLYYVGYLICWKVSHNLLQVFKNCPTDKQRNHTYTEISKGTVMLHKPVATAFNLPYIQNSSPPLLVHWSHTILYERAWCQTFRAAQHGLLIGMIQIGTADKLLFHAAVRGALKNGHVQIYATFVSLYWHYSVVPATGEALLCYENI